MILKEVYKNNFNINNLLKRIDVNPSYSFVDKDLCKMNLVFAHLVSLCLDD